MAEKSDRVIERVDSFFGNDASAPGKDIIAAVEVTAELLDESRISLGVFAGEIHFPNDGGPGGLIVIAIVGGEGESGRKKKKGKRGQTKAAHS